MAAVGLPVVARPLLVRPVSVARVFSAARRSELLCAAAMRDKRPMMGSLAALFTGPAAAVGLVAAGVMEWALGLLMASGFKVLALSMLLLLLLLLLGSSCRERHRQEQQNNRHMS